MKFITVSTYEKMISQAANIISAQVIMKPDCVLGLATGSSPVGVYRQLIDWYNKGDIDFSQVTTVNLDEYVGLTGDHPQSYRYFMQENFFDHINIDPSRTFVPCGTAADPAAECAEYDARIKRFGGIDLQLLGIGLGSTNRATASSRRRTLRIFTSRRFVQTPVSSKAKRKCRSRRSAWAWFRSCRRARFF